MSMALDMADEMAAYLETLPVLEGIDVIVDRQKDIETAVLTGVQKAKGLAVVILYTGGRNLTSEKPNIILKEVNYAVAVHSLPVIQQSEGHEPNDEVCEEIQKALHGWAPDTGSLKGNKVLCQTLMQYVGDELVPDDSLLVYDNQFKIQLRIE